MPGGLGCPDLLIGLLLGDSAIIMVKNWQGYAECPVKIQYWALVHYCLVAGFRVSHVVWRAREEQQSTQGDQETDDATGQRRRCSLELAKGVLGAFFAAFVISTIWGFCWLSYVAAKAPDCMPPKSGGNVNDMWLLGTVLLCSVVTSVLYTCFLQGRLPADPRRPTLRRQQQQRNLLGNNTGRGRGGAPGVVPSRPSRMRGLTLREIDEVAPVRRISAEDLQVYREVGFPSVCSICMEEIVERVDTRALVCQHIYHAKCISRWLQERPTCPNCNHMVLGDAQV